MNVRTSGGVVADRFHTLTGLVAGYVVLSLGSIGVLALLRQDHPAQATTNAWVRASIVAATSLLMLIFTRRAARGSRGAYRRLRVVSAVMVIAIAVIVAIPGFIPTWLRVEQVACGVLLLGVVALANGSHLRAAFAH